MQSPIRRGGCSGRFFGRLFSVAAALAGACAGAAQEAPLVSGNYAIANKFLHGDAHVVLLGDSIQNGITGFYPRHWKVDKWAGQVVSPNLNSVASGNTGAYVLGLHPPFVNSSSIHAPDVPPAGLAGYGPGWMQLVTFKAAQAPPGGLLDNRFMSFGLNANQDQIYHSGKWADRSDGQINVDVLLYGNPQGIESGAQLDVRTNSLTTPVLTVPLSARSPQGKWLKFSGSFPAHPWNPGGILAGEFRLAPGTTSEAGSNLPILGVRYHTGEKGFQFASIAQGAKGIDHFLDPVNTTEQNLKDYLDFTDTNMAMIWIGQNDMGRDSPALWKLKMQQLIARYKAAREDMQFVLVSTYDTDANKGDGNQPAQYAQVLHEIAQSDPDVLFLNLYRAAGDFTFLRANYLEDPVHPNFAGMDYFAAKTQELLALADAQVPEPGGLLAVAGALGILGRRGRRGARA